MSNHNVIQKFYTAFSEGNSKGMTACYHDEVVFQDPAFGKLVNNKPAKMWEMLLSSKGANPKISYSNIEADDHIGSVDWKAEYVYGPKKRKVVNHISANFKFKDGLIIEHKDQFNIWRWSSQALGPVGYLLGWTPFMKSKIQKLANDKLNKYVEQSLNQK